jgi:glycosyltransferase involved in cell wall biosynthesis
MKKISIVIPLFNEEKRLEFFFKKFKKFNSAKKKVLFEFIFVDDGSTDTTNEKILNFIKKNKSKKNKFNLIKSDQNYGKGHALKLGIKFAKYNWILTMDADLSVDLFQILEWTKKYNFEKNYAYFGSRNHPKSLIKYKYYRRVIGHILRVLVFLFVDNKIRDTQCGFKFYNKKYIKKIFSLINEKGFVHDIELVLLLKNNKIRIKELPIRWVHMDNSKLNPFSESAIFFINFFKLLIKYKLKR